MCNWLLVCNGNIKALALFELNVYEYKNFYSVKKKQQTKNIGGYWDQTRGHKAMTTTEAIGDNRDKRGHMGL